MVRPTFVPPKDRFVPEAVSDAREGGLPPVRQLLALGMAEHPGPAGYSQDAHACQNGSPKRVQTHGSTGAGGDSSQRRPRSNPARSGSWHPANIASTRMIAAISRVLRDNARDGVVVSSYEKDISSHLRIYSSRYPIGSRLGSPDSEHATHRAARTDRILVRRHGGEFRSGPGGIICG